MEIPWKSLEMFFSRKYLVRFERELNAPCSHHGKTSEFTLQHPRLCKDEARGRWMFNYWMRKTIKVGRFLIKRHLFCGPLSRAHLWKTPVVLDIVAELTIRTRGTHSLRFDLDESELHFGVSWTGLLSLWYTSVITCRDGPVRPPKNQTLLKGSSVWNHLSHS